MQSVHFGRENSMNPTGSHESIGVGEGKEIIVRGDFIGIITIDRNNYLVTRTTMAFDDNNVGKIAVRRAIVDLYRDSSGILYLDQLHTDDCKKLEEALNSSRGQTLLNRGERVVDICDAHTPDESFECVTRGEDIVATAIKHEVFEDKKKAIANCNEPFSVMQKRIWELEAQLAQINNHSSNYHR